jgi:hypothetical protein
MDRWLKTESFEKTRKQDRFQIDEKQECEISGFHTGEHEV